MGVVPQALLNRPTLNFRQAYFFNAFQAMSGSRNASMAGALPIPLTEIKAYCELLYIAKLDEREQLLRYVRQIDNAYLDWAAEQSAKSSKK